MQEWVQKDVTDGVTWFCKQRETRKFIHDGSFFLSPGCHCKNGSLCCGFGQENIWQLRQEQKQKLVVLAPLCISMSGKLRAKYRSCLMCQAMT